MSNKIYVANSDSSNVTVIDGATNITTTVTDPNATRPFAIAVNPVSNKIYVANENSANVTVIDGATNNTTTVGAGNGAFAMAVNPVTNKIYVANFGLSNSVTVIDGPTNTTTTVSAGSFPFAVAVNAVTNKIYVANQNSNNVTVIDGATNTTTTVGVGNYPQGVAVNAITNKIYVANLVSGTVTVIDGATNTTTTVSAGTNPQAVAVNPVTNKIYVVNSGICCPSSGSKCDGDYRTASAVNSADHLDYAPAEQHLHQSWLAGLHLHYQQLLHTHRATGAERLLPSGHLAGALAPSHWRLPQLQRRGACAVARHSHCLCLRRRRPVCRLPPDRRRQ